MEFGLTEEQRIIKQTAREFADEKLAPLAAEYDRSEEFTAPQAKLLGRDGLPRNDGARRVRGRGTGHGLLCPGDGRSQPRVRLNQRHHDSAKLARMLAPGEVRN